MDSPHCRARRALLVVGMLAGALLVGAPAASGASRALDLDWEACPTEGFECATAQLPLDYGNPGGRKVAVDVARLPAAEEANRLGSLFINFGGPGDSTAETFQAIGPELWTGLNDTYDIVAFNPRGTGPNGIDCKANQETEGVYSQPFATPDSDLAAYEARVRGYVRKCTANNRDMSFWTTANTARDMDRLRAAVGDSVLNYLGFSYGTFLGATYETLFPNRVGQMVLDGALNPDQYANRPLDGLREQSAGFEKAFGRFMQACASDQTACLGFGGKDPWNAFDELVEKADAAPIPVQGSSQTINGDDIDAATLIVVYSKFNWPLLAQALADAAAGDGTLMQLLVDAFYGKLEDGTFDPLTDRYFALGALEQRYPADVGTYLRAGEHSWGLFDHFWLNAGYVEMNWGLFPINPNGVYRGPFENAAGNPTTLVVGTTYDPATPYRGAKRLVAQLGNARLLTMRGDGHTAYLNGSPCIDAAIEAYLEEGTVPARGTQCKQDVPFAQEPAARMRAAVQIKQRQLRLHVKPFVK